MSEWLQVRTSPTSCDWIPVTSVLKIAESVDDRVTVHFVDGSTETYFDKNDFKPSTELRAEIRRLSGIEESAAKRPHFKRSARTQEDTDIPLDAR